eukprot:TRINITY_DN43498_c0_g1_i1.p1 TRINITY_DN43498_c0_g1~~TRINITY_DN43498_c0_g1_i1.p1  ORF type:complete len:539 (+),score=136.15 TRINITY_DN43498_c0_g1_i1:136-1752(+)
MCGAEASKQEQEATSASAAEEAAGGGQAEETQQEMRSVAAKESSGDASACAGGPKVPAEIAAEDVQDSASADVSRSGGCEERTQDVVEEAPQKGEGSCQIAAPADQNTEGSVQPPPGLMPPHEDNSAEAVSVPPGLDSDAVAAAAVAKAVEEGKGRWWDAWPTGPPSTEKKGGATAKAAPTKAKAQALPPGRVMPPCAALESEGTTDLGASLESGETMVSIDEGYKGFTQEAVVPQGEAPRRRRRGRSSHSKDFQASSKSPAAAKTTSGEKKNAGRWVPKGESVERASNSKPEEQRPCRTKRSRDAKRSGYGSAEPGAEKLRRSSRQSRDPVRSGTASVGAERADRSKRAGKKTPGGQMVSKSTQTTADASTQCDDDAPDELELLPCPRSRKTLSLDLLIDPVPPRWKTETFLDDSLDTEVLVTYPDEHSVLKKLLAGDEWRPVVVEPEKKKKQVTGDEVEEDSMKALQTVLSLYADEPQEERQSDEKDKLRGVEDRRVEKPVAAMVTLSEALSASREAASRDLGSLSPYESLLSLHV